MTQRHRDRDTETQRQRHRDRDAETWRRGDVERRSRISCGDDYLEALAEADVSTALYGRLTAEENATRSNHFHDRLPLRDVHPRRGLYIEQSLLQLLLRHGNLLL
jgi:hypothetical protein